jgi:hypothetical protein
MSHDDDDVFGRRNRAGGPDYMFHQTHPAGPMQDFGLLGLHSGT